MASNPQTASMLCSSEAEVMSAASAIFGALELIGETSCSESAKRNVEVAEYAVHAGLAELGLTQADLLQAADRDRLRRIDRVPGSVPITPHASQPAGGIVVPLRPRRPRPPC